MIAKSTSGFPALRKLLRDDFPPFLRAADPFLRNLNPILTGLGNYKHELTAAMANVAAATQAVRPPKARRPGARHYLRAMGPFNPESLATFDTRLATQPHQRLHPAAQPTRTSPRACPASTRRLLGPERDSQPKTSINEPAFNQRFKSGEEIKKATVFFEALKKYAFSEQESSANIPAPACTQQAPFPPIDGNGPATSYQHTFEQGK